MIVVAGPPKRNGQAEGTPPAIWRRMPRRSARDWPPDRKRVSLSDSLSPSLYLSIYLSTYRSIYQPVSSVCIYIQIIYIHIYIYTHSGYRPVKVEFCLLPSTITDDVPANFGFHRSKIILMYNRPNRKASLPWLRLIARRIPHILDSCDPSGYMGGAHPRTNALCTQRAQTLKRQIIAPQSHIYMAFHVCGISDPLFV